MSLSTSAPHPQPLDIRAPNMVNEWEHWKRVYERYCRMTKVTEEADKQDVFWSFIGRETEDYLRNLPNFDSLETVNSLLQVLAERFKLVPNELCERFNFRQVKIMPGETIEDFNIRLNKFSKHCKFDNYSSELAHLDQIILNATPHLREKLLMEKGLTLTKALEIAKYAAEGKQWASQFPEVPNVKIKQEVNFNKNVKSDFKSSGTGNKVKQCFRCGSKSHLANENNCPAKKVKCRKCNKVGHYAKYCLVKKSFQSKEESKTVSNVNAREHVAQFEILKVDSLSVLLNSRLGDDSHKYVDLTINKVPIPFMIDSGSQATIIPMSVFNKLGSTLLPATASLVDFNGNSIELAGECTVNVIKGNDNFQSKAFVTKIGNRALLGSGWISLFSNVDWTALLKGSVPNKNVCTLTTDSVENILSEFKCVFDINNHAKVVGRKATLVLKKDAVPKFANPYTVPIAFKPQVEAEIDKMVDSGFWTPVTESKWATALVPVMKSNNQVRLCGNYKVTVNPQLEIAHHPLPTSEDIFTKLNNNKVFSKLDLRNAFQQLELDDESKEICTVNTTKGLFRVNRLPYGIASSPALWQRTVDSILQGLDGVLCFVDDILIGAPDLKIHNTRLRSVLEALKRNNVHVKEEKCSFAVNNVSYLGFQVDSNGIHKTDDKIRAIQEVPVPTSVTELKSFLELITFYARFVPNLATVAEPLYKLTKKKCSL